jgi:hypothetical protein
MNEQKKHYENSRGVRANERTSARVKKKINFISTKRQTAPDCDSYMYERASQSKRSGLVPSLARGVAKGTVTESGEPERESRGKMELEA